MEKVWEALLLHLETDYSMADAAQLQTRVEAFPEVLWQDGSGGQRRDPGSPE